tara:strand:+ start:1703 stop:2563 length:861 start_codon:yes stop_codon:yes gene_type:complete
MNYIFTSEFPDAGSGNKLFVFFLGKILSKKYSIPYFYPGIPELNIKGNEKNIHNDYENFIVKDFFNMMNGLDFHENINYNILYSFNPTIEDYRLFKENISLCKSIYPLYSKPYDSNDIVYHFRAGDYFFDNNHYLLNGWKLEKLLEHVEYNQLYIVTNLTKKNTWSMDDYLRYREKYLVHGIHATPYLEHQCVQPDKFQEVLDHINSVIKVCNDRNCIWISESVSEDFNTLRNFNKIIINVSTLSWWAAVLSNASEVYVPQRWKYKKKNNKNLPNIDLPGWKKVDL